MHLDRLIGEQHDAAIDAAEAALGDDIVRRRELPRRRQTSLHMIGIDPVIGIEQTDGIIAFADAGDKPDSARGVAEIAMGAIQRDVPDSMLADPLDGMTVGDEQMRGRYALHGDAGDTAFQRRTRLAIIRRDDQHARLAGRQRAHAPRSARAQASVAAMPSR